MSNMKAAIHILAIVGCASAQFNTTAQTDIVKVHNDLKSAIAKGNYTAKGTIEPAAANMRKMKWDASLAASAQKYADGCPYSYSYTEGVGGNFRTILSPYGQPTNLNTFGAQSAKAWANEFQVKGWTSIFFDAKTFNSGIGNATQMAWAETNLVGCGVKACGLALKDYFDYYKTVVVCQYKKQGNVLNTNIYQKGKTCSFCPSGSTCETSSGLCA